MSYSNRELVEFFISYRLSQRNHPTSLLRSQDGGGGGGGGRSEAEAAAGNGLQAKSRDGCEQTPVSNGPGDGAEAAEGAEGVEAVKAALRDSADEFELLFTQAFSDLALQLDITPDTAYHSFRSVMDEVFKDGVNWGRIVGLFCFGGVLCVECVEKNMSELVSRIADWMTMYLDERISAWIQSQGGWDCFAEIFGQDASAEARRYQERVRNWLLLGVGVLTGVLVAMLVAKRQ